MTTLTSKADQAYTIAKARIVDGTYGPGFRLVIDQLVREHRISSVPWREALRRLEAEEWIDIVPNVGAVVKSHDDLAWSRSMALLARLDGLAVAVSAPGLTEEDLQRATQINERLREAVANFEPEVFTALNYEFHQLLRSGCDDLHLSAVTEAEAERVNVLRRSSVLYTAGRATKALDEHDEIVALIESGAEPQEVELAVKTHGEANLAALLEYDATAYKN